MSAFKPFLQYFSTGSDTASCQDYVEYEFCWVLLEKAQIVDLFKHCNFFVSYKHISSLSRGVHAHSCIMGNQGKMVGNN